MAADPQLGAWSQWMVGCFDKSARSNGGLIQCFANGVNRPMGHIPFVENFMPLGHGPLLEDVDDQVLQLAAVLVPICRRPEASIVDELRSADRMAEVPPEIANM